jgi:tol-pal system protein YbgF
MIRIADRRSPIAAALLAIALLAGCGSTADPAPAPAPVPVDTHLNDLQASMTELLERLDVMNSRIAKLEKAAEERPQPTAIAPAQPTQSAAVRPVPSIASGASRAITNAQIADVYRNGIVLFGKNRYSESRGAFQQVFDADSSGELADNALFWIGETYYAAGDFNNAIRFYKRVSEEYGDQNKAPDAMYKLALAYEKTSDLGMARTTLQSVISRYPYSSPAAAAKTELNRIKY